MAKTAKQRQAEYRARRKEQGLCAFPGCNRKPRKYSLCPYHREDAKELARDRTLTASMYDALRERNEQLERTVKELEREVNVLIADNLRAAD